MTSNLVVNVVNDLRGENVDVCKHCGRDIVKYTYEEDGFVWWHINGTAIWNHCGSVADEALATLAASRGPGEPPLVAEPIAPNR